MMQSVTLAIPTFNRPKLLDATLKSAVRQDYPNLKIVVSDNASEGVETRSTVEGYMRDDPRISYSVQPENCGPGANFLWLLDHAATALFMWLSDDDELKHHDHITQLVHGFQRDSSAVLVFPDIDIVKNAERTEHQLSILKRRFEKCKTDDDYLLAWCRFGGGHPFYGLYKTDHLRRHFLSHINTEWAYYGEGIFLHHMFMLGGVRFCDTATLVYNQVNSGTRIRSRSMLSSFLKYSLATHKLYWRSERSLHQRLNLLRIIGRSHYPYILFLMKKSLMNEMGG